MRPRRVLFIEANEDGSVGGSHQVLFDMVRYLDRTRVEPVVLFYQDNRFSALLRESGVHVLTWDDIRARELSLHRSGRLVDKVLEVFRAIARRYSFLRAEQIDIVHVNNSPRTGRDDWLPAARMRRIPIVASARGDADPLPGSGVRARIHRTLMRRFDRVIAVSEYIAESMRAQRIPARNIVVVHDGVDRSKVSMLSEKPAAALRQELSVPPGRLLVAAIGNVRSWKGQHVVLEALARLSPEDRDCICVVFVGAVRDEDREYRAMLDGIVKVHGLQSCVRFSGSRTDVPDILATADMMVHSSTMPEPGGTVVIESMTFGAPVIVASKGGHLDYLTEGLGLVHDVTRPDELAAHLRTLINDPRERDRMSRMAKVRAAEFSIEHTAAKMHRIYDELCGIDDRAQSDRQ